ncbi:MAG: gluconeogenesis factor YvcK family protein [Nocardioides sp.]
MTGAPDPAGPAVVAFGGGHGLHASLSALRRVTDHLTAVVTVADNGGSSGKLRAEFDVLPPGDLRMALAALCDDTEWGRTWARVLQHRLSGTGQLRDHAIGNLLIVGLWELLDDPVAGLDWIGRLLRAHGRVLPMSEAPMNIRARVRGADPGSPDRVVEVIGQVQVATTPGRIVDIALDPPDAPACPDALGAVKAADWVVLGPGSWFSSVIPHLLLPALRQALECSSANVIVVLNLEPQRGETPGSQPEDYLAALLRYAPGLRIHTVIADPHSVPAESGLAEAVTRLGARLMVADVASPDDGARHDPAALASAYAEAMNPHRPRTDPRRRRPPDEDI